MVRQPAAEVLQNSFASAESLPNLGEFLLPKDI